MRPVPAQDLLIGHTVMRERLRKGITQNEVARAVGVSLRTLQSWEAGRDPVPDLRRPALAAALGIPASALDLPGIEPLSRVRGPSQAVGCCVMPKTGPVTNHERAQMRALREAEISVEAIGAELGRSGRCVSEHVRDIPVRCRPGRPGRDAAGNDRLLAAHADGVERHELAERFGLKPQSVMPIISRMRRLRAAQPGSADRDQARIA